MRDRDGKIRDEAYRIWVERGRPEGGEQEHWLEAERRVSATEGGFAGSTRAAKAPGEPRVVAKNAGNGGVAVPPAKAAKLKSANDGPRKAAPSKGAAVDIAPVKKPAAKRKPATKPKA